MKKPEEIKKGLECCNSLAGCGECPYKVVDLGFDGDVCTCDDRLERDALAYIQQLEEEKAALIEALRTADKDCEFCKHANAYGQACVDNDFTCGGCTVLEQCPCCDCSSLNNHWEWCGVRSENTEVENDKSAT